MNDNVIPFKNSILFNQEEYREILIWQCNCGSTEFHYHIADGLECVACGTFQEGQDDEI
jgi:hypothetical protein